MNRGRLMIAGLVAGSLITAGAGYVLAADVKLVARLTGEAEVPGPGDEDGSGRGVVRVNVNKRRICYRITFRDIAEPNGGHIHKAPKGQSGDVVVPLFEGTTGSPVEDCTRVARSIARGIKRNPKGFYINIHNEEFPAGAIRGQLRRPR